MNGLLPALTATAAVLAGVVAVELVTGNPAPPATRPGAGARAASTADRPGDPLPDQVAALLARPPFAPSRRPEAVAGSDDPRLPHLTGILVTSQDRRAIFAGRDGARGAVVGPGDQVGAYRVQEISATDVTLTGADGAHIMRPTFSAAPPPAAQSPNALSALAPLPGAFAVPQIPPPATAPFGAPAGIVQTQAAPVGAASGSLK